MFASLRIPYEPVRWVPDVTVRHEGQIDKGARVVELIEAYRRNGHLMADTDPLEFKVRTHPDLDITSTVCPVGPRPAVPGRRVRRREGHAAARRPRCAAQLVLPHVGIEYMHITDPEEREWLQKRIEVKHDAPDRAKQKHVLGG